MDAPGDNQDLLDRARCGDRGAAELLLRAHWGMLERHARARLGPRLGAQVEVEDVLQETSARALASLPSFEPAGEDAFARWLRGIAEHVILEAAKRARRRPVLPLDDDVAGTEAAPSKLLRREERLARFEEALAGLSPEYRQVITWSRLEGLRVKEIAARLGRSPKAVAHVISRALKKLKEAIGETESLHLPPRPLRSEEGTNGD